MISRTEQRKVSRTTWVGTDSRVLPSLHSISSLFLYDDSRKYKERITAEAIESAFLEEPLPEASLLTLPYAYRTKWSRILDVYRVHLHRLAIGEFRELRQWDWGVNENEYNNETQGDWSPMGTMGLSGSLFFVSKDGHYIAKSIGRTFENRFLYERFLPKYFDYVRANPDTFLNKIYDVLYSFDRRLGETLNCSPSHYLIIENVLYGQTDEWEKFDLKPTSYIGPFRDLLPKHIPRPGATDILPDNKMIKLSKSDREAFLTCLRRDTEFLQGLGVIDYSILLIRIPDGSARFAIIDFFWSLEETRPKTTKKASDAVGLPRQTITADKEGYAEDIIRMMERCVQVRHD